MKRPRPLMHRALACVVSFALVCTSARADEAGAWRAGAASVVITPEAPMWMAGYAARTRPAEGTAQDLKAKALAVEDGTGRRAVVVTADLVGIPRDVSVRVCDAIAAAHGLGRDAVLLSASHTHSGPVLGDTLRPAYELDEAQRALVARYTRFLEARLAEVAAAALADLAPAELAYGVGKATFAVNRRNNREADVPRLREEGRLVGPVDHDVPVLSVRRPDGTLAAVLFGYACHATTLNGYEWSADYPGYAQAVLEEAHPGATAMFVAGCGADQNPLPRRSVELAERYGRRLAAATDDVLAAPMRPLKAEIGTSYEEVSLPFAGLPTREQLEREAGSSDRFSVARAKLLLGQWDQAGSLRPDYPYPVQAWRLGDLTFVALGGEVVADYSLRLKAECGPGPVWAAAYANDVMAYIPSARVLAEGGYEGGEAMVYSGLPSPWTPRVEEIVVTAVQDQVRRVRPEGSRADRGPGR